MLRNPALATRTPLARLGDVAPTDAIFGPQSGLYKHATKHVSEGRASTHAPHIVRHGVMLTRINHAGAPRALLTSLRAESRCPKSCPSLSFMPPLLSPPPLNTTD